MAALSDIDLLERLVGFDSTSRTGTRGIAGFIATYLDRTGSRLACYEGSAAAAEDPEQVSVVASIGPERSDRAGLVLCGHLDAVPAVEPDWTGDPFVMRREPGRLTGRGTCDMKGFVALAVNLLREIDGEALDAPLALVLTCDEERGSLGAKHLVQQVDDLAALPRHVVVGEPTSLRVVRMHKGHVKVRVAVHGRPAHSGTPQLGRNAIEAAGRIVVELADLAASMRGERRDTSAGFPDVPYPVLNVGTIEGGDATNVVPGRCVVDIGIRVLPGDDAAAVVERVRRIAAGDVGADRVDVEVLDDNPPMLLREDAPIYRRVCDLVGQTESIGVSFASDAGVLSRDAGMDCVLFGPGSMAVAHRADEWIAPDDMKRGAELLRELVALSCFES